MESLILSIGERRNSVAEIYRGGSESFSVGRGLRNAVVLTDPYAGAVHLEFFRQDGHWYARAHDEVNPALLNDSPIGREPARLREGDRITIGRTHLDIFSEDFQVQPARKLLLSGWLYQGRKALFAGVLATFAVALLDGSMNIFEYSQAENRDEEFTTGLSTVAMIFTWAGIWALIGRLTRHQSHFAIQLLVTALVSGLVSLVLPVPDYVDFLFSSQQAGSVAGYLLAIAMLALLLRWNIYYATHPDNPGTSAIIIALFCVGTYYTVDRLQAPEYNPNPHFSATLKPPLFVPDDGITARQFLQRSGETAKAAAAVASTDEKTGI